MGISWKSNPARFHLDPRIWNDKALGFFEEVAPQDQQDE